MSPKLMYKLNVISIKTQLLQIRDNEFFFKNQEILELSKRAWGKKSLARIYQNTPQSIIIEPVRKKQRHQGNKTVLNDFCFSETGFCVS